MTSSVNVPIVGDVPLWIVATIGLIVFLVIRADIKRLNTGPSDLAWSEERLRIIQAEDRIRALTPGMVWSAESFTLPESQAEAGKTVHLWMSGNTPDDDYYMNSRLHQMTHLPPTHKVLRITYAQASLIAEQAIKICDELGVHGTVAVRHERRPGEGSVVRKTGESPVNEETG